MKSLRKNMRKSTPVILGVLVMLVTMGCFNRENKDPGLVYPPDKSTFSGMQTVLVTNASGTLMETEQKIIADIARYNENGTIEITLRERFNDNPREWRLEGNITSNNRIRVQQVNTSSKSNDESDGELNTAFEEFFGLGTFNLQDNCPEWYGTLKDGQLEISCNFCCNAAGMQNTAIGKVTCSLDQM